MLKLVVFLVFIAQCIYGRPIETFYGIVEVDEPVLLELIDSNAFQRLKKVNQYGVSYYTTHREEFSRYSHSLGVFHLLRENKRPLKEQIAGLLHDVSHTAFSHVGDWVFNREYNEIDYQNSIHEEFLNTRGLTKILIKHGICSKDILPTEKNAPALETQRPNASADRLDYSIQGAYHQKFLTKTEALDLFKDCKYENNKWITTRPDLMTKVIQFTLYMTENCFSNPTNHLSSRFLADAIIKALEIQLIHPEEFHFGTDEALWNKLMTSDNTYIKSCMEKTVNAHQLYTLTNPNEADTILITKFWGFDPWILQNKQLVRLTTIDPMLEKEYHEVKARIAKGFAIKLVAHENAFLKSS